MTAAASPPPRAAGTLGVMVLAPAPSLTYVLGLPAGLMVVVGLVGFAAWAVLGRISRG
jgi:hypothetical protein